MGQRVEPPEEAAGLGAAARRYAAHLLGAAADFYPGAVEPARAFFALVGRTEPDADADAPPAQAAWAWARFLAGWPEWRPHRLERRLVLPPIEDLRVLADRAREAASPAEPLYRRWLLFTRAAAAASAEPRELLTQMAEALDAVAVPTGPAAVVALDRAAELGRAVEDRIAALPRDWVPVRLARTAATLPEWPPSPPGDAAPEFLPWLAAVVRFAVEHGPIPTAPELFSAILREALDDLRGGGHVPADGPAAAALDAFRRLDLPVPEAEWFRVFAALLEVAPPADPKARWPRLLARLACRAVEQVAPNAEPPVDPDSLTVPRDWGRPGRAEVKFVTHPAAPRTVMKVERFAVPPKRAAVVVSLGPHPAGTTVWLTLTGPDRLPGVPDGDGTKLVARCRKRGEAELWGRVGGDDPRGLRKEWAAWLATEAGQEWFNALASKAVAQAPDAAEARVRLGAVAQTADVACFPTIDHAAGWVGWPNDVPFTSARVSFTVDDSLPGSIVGVDQFARRPAEARFQVSLGPAGPTGTAVAAVWEAVIAAGPNLAEFRATLAPILEAAARTGEEFPADLLPKLLDRLGELDPATGSAAARDALLARLREWAAAEGLTLQPPDWTFAGGGPAPPVESAGLVVKPVFRRDVPGGRVVKVKAFGLYGPQGVIREGEVVTSAGRAPHGLPELDAAAEAVEGPAGKELREALWGLRAAGAGGFMELALIDLFTRFWDNTRAAWAQSDPDAADDFGAKLETLLEENFKLSAFRPANVREKPNGWVSIPPGTRMTTGRVVRVLRPGLAAGDELRVPARVEAE